MGTEQTELNTLFAERLKLLPQPVQNAIITANVEKRLRSLEGTHKLHVDQWELLENEVMLALLGIQPAEDLEKNIAQEVGLAPEVANTLARDISLNIFEPIRAELERELEHPEAKSEEKSGIEVAREQVLAGNQQETAPAVIPATPLQPPPTTKVERGPASGTYKPGEPSTERKNIHDDPYREPPA
ncbi:hypothetical protein C4585_02820 [Candidatus Parcubacteria bacterium]|nr:MAG: hypothetical protein C4585_02820 [Candidatus Parcubacteria bacterium]